MIYHQQMSLQLSQKQHINNIFASMGICNNKAKEKEIAFSTKAILQPQKYELMNFYFSTENLLRIDADCLIIYCNEKRNLSKNIYLSQVGKLETRKIGELAQASLQTSKSKLQPGQILLFPIAVPTLRFKYTCLVCLKVWNGHEKIQQNLQKIVENMFKQIEKNNIQSIALTEFNQQFGIPTQIGCKVMVDGISVCKEWLKIVTFICNDISTQTYYMERINQSKNGKNALSNEVEKDKPNRQSRQSIESVTSNYY